MAIDLEQVLSIVESREWFSCKIITANQSQKTGGEIRSLRRVKLLSSEKNKTVKPEKGDSTAEKYRQKKAAEHNYHFTRNLITKAGEIIKIHPLLIFEINGTPVI